MSIFFSNRGIKKTSDSVKGRGKQSKMTETTHFASLSALLHQNYGVETAWLKNDWSGADFVAFHPDPSRNFCIWVQLKSRVTIKKSYKNKGDLCIAFIHGDDWYIVPHEELLKLVPDSWLISSSWKNKGIYHSSSPGKGLLQNLLPYKL